MMFVYNPPLALRNVSMFCIVLLVQETMMKNKNLRQIFHASFSYKTTCTSFLSVYRWHYQC